MEPMQISLWFVDQAEEAAQHYIAIFGGEVTTTLHNPQQEDGSPGGVVSVDFIAGGQSFVAINGGEHDKPNDAVSISVLCDDQAEVDRYWEALVADGGREVQCGWLKDKYGFSWQITPIEMSQLLADPDPDRKARAFQAMYAMKKLDVAAMRAAMDNV
ncbi:MAG: VOC family protein [Propionibacteriales bacterium]|nr:VOC family protein [Propionibacteriales bacterium]